MTEKYIVQERVRHSVTRRYYEPGEEIPVDHVSPPQLAALVARGVLRRVEAAAPEKPARVTDTRKVREDKDDA